MSDQLKKYIQQSKHSFDVEEPNPNLFNKILNQVEINQTNKFALKTRFKNNKQWFLIAASFVLLISATIILKQVSNNSPAKNSEIVEQSNIKSNSNDLNKSLIAVDKAPQLVDVFNNAKEIPVKNTKANSTTIRVKDEAPVTVNFKNQENVVHLKEIVQEIAMNELAQENSKATQLEKQSINLLENNPATFKGETLEVQNKYQSTQIANDPILAEAPMNSDVENVETLNPENNVKSKPQDQTLKGSIKRGFFGFISKKAKQWSGDALSIENIEKNDRPVLAIHFKNEKLEFSKSINLRNSSN
ncbi:MAG: hypothetical protein IPL31_02340 [Saprospiraceae bacterium]|nr:hypothetical protein [Saprospiraceae bacterium]